MAKTKNFGEYLRKKMDADPRLKAAVEHYRANPHLLTDDEIDEEDSDVPDTDTEEDDE